MANAPPTRDTKSNHTLVCDWQKWMGYLAEENIPDDQKRQIIEIYWSIVVAFIEFGWEVKSPEDLAPTMPQSCGQAPDLSAALREAVLGSETTPKISASPEKIAAPAEREAQ